MECALENSFIHGEKYQRLENITHLRNHSLAIFRTQSNIILSEADCNV